MNINEIKVGENTIWLVVEPYRYGDQEGKNVENFICYFKLSPPNMFIYGELLKKEDGNPVIFDSVEKAIEYTSTFFNEKKFYKHPLNYNKEELHKILNIPMRIKYKEQEISKVVVGSIKDFSVAYNPPNLPYKLHIETSENITFSINVFDIENFGNI